MTIKGIDEVRKRLHDELNKKMALRAERAVKVATSIIAGYALLKTPVDTSVLKNSQYQVIEQDKQITSGKVGYSARYAHAVHEASGKLKGEKRSKKKGRERGNYWDPDAEPHFLTSAAEDSKAEINQAVKKAMKI